MKWQIVALLLSTMHLFLYSQSKAPFCVRKSIILYVACVCVCVCIIGGGALCGGSAGPLHTTGRCQGSEDLHV